MFKKYVQRLVEAKTRKEVLTILGEADRAFQMEKISWKDHELLFDLGAALKVAQWD